MGGVPVIAEHQSLHLEPALTSSAAGGGPGFAVRLAGYPAGRPFTRSERCMSEHTPHTIDYPGSTAEMAEEPQDEMRAYRGNDLLKGKRRW